MDGFWFYITIMAVLPLAERLIDKALGGDRKPCPQCAERIQEDATVCRFCGYRFPAPELSQDTEPTATVSTKSPDAVRVKRLRGRLRLYRFIIMLLLFWVIYLASLHRQESLALKQWSQRRAGTFVGNPFAQQY